MADYTFKGYVLYSKDNTEQLQQFYQQDTANIYSPIQRVELSDSFYEQKLDLFFNSKDIKGLLTSEDVSEVISHIQCWKNIADNQEIGDDEFVLVVDSKIEFQPNYLVALKDFLQNKFHYSQYNLVQLQCSNLSETYWREQKYSGEGELDGTVYDMAYPFDLMGRANFYAIRKSKAISILVTLSDKKPHWLMHEFSKFCHWEEILRTSYMLGYIPDENLEKKKHSKVNEPLFSIIIPIYNVDKYLSIAIESVIKQTYKNYEIILVNDGSTDSSGKIAYEYSEKYNNVIFVNKPNSGVSETRNIGIHIARGKYIMWLDSDDYWEGDNILFELSKIVSDSEPDMIINFSSDVLEDRIIHNIPFYQEASNNFTQDSLDLLEKGVYLGFPWSKIIKTSLIKENKIFFPTKRVYEDVMWSFDLIKYIKTYKIYHSHFYMYRRQREGSITKHVSLKNQESLFLNYLEKFDELAEADSKKIETYSTLEKYLNNMAEYTDKCYSLLYEKEQVALCELKEKFDKCRGL